MALRQNTQDSLHQAIKRRWAIAKPERKHFELREQLADRKGGLGHASGVSSRIFCSAAARLAKSSCQERAKADGAGISSVDVMLDRVGALAVFVSGRELLL